MSRVPHPRAEVAALLERYNRPLGASEQTLSNIAALADRDVYCVVGGQQAGLLGGPAYVAYKIDCTVRLARRISEVLGVRVVPMFWLASEDHDFGEINHAHFVQRDGEIGRVSFDWRDKGRPIAGLDIAEEVREAIDAYWSSAQPGPFAESVRSLIEPHNSRYCDWLAAFWLRLFAGDGLVVVEPATLRPVAGSFSQRALQDRAVLLRVFVKIPVAEQDGRPRALGENFLVDFLDDQHAVLFIIDCQIFYMFGHTLTAAVGKREKSLSHAKNQANLAQSPEDGNRHLTGIVPGSASTPVGQCSNSYLMSPPLCDSPVSVRKEKPLPRV